mgnify:CR=1 FL=1|jgi:hypothetical protein
MTMFEKEAAAMIAHQHPNFSSAEIEAAIKGARQARYAPDADDADDIAFAAMFSISADIRA